MQINLEEKNNDEDTYNFLNPQFRKSLAINLALKPVYQPKESFVQVPNPIQNEVQVIQDYILQNIKSWEITDKQEYQFELPPTIFQGAKPCVEFKEQQFEVEQFQLGQLQSDQLKQIWNTGTFEVKSKQFPYPYTWKLSQFIFQGRTNINKIFTWHMAQSFGCALDSIKYIHNSNFKQEGQQCSIVRGVKNIFKVSIKLFGLFFGKPLYKKLHIPRELEEYRRQLLLEASEKLGKQALNLYYFNDVHKAYDNMEKLYSGLKAQVQGQNLKACEKFDQYKELPPDIKSNIKILMDAHEYMCQQNQEIQQKLHFCPKKQNILLQPKPSFFNASCLCTKKQESQYSISIGSYYRDIKIPEMNQLYMEGIKKRQQKEQCVETQYPILKYYRPFKAIKLYELFDKEWDYYENLRDKNILEYLNSKGYNLQNLYYQEFVQFHTRIDSIIKFIKKTKKVPKSKVMIYRLYTTVQKIVSRKLESGELYYYILKDEVFFEQETTCFFWRIIVLFVRYYVYTINIIDFFIHQTFFGKYSFKSLFYWKPFYTQYHVHSDKGDKYYLDTDKVYPPYKNFMNVIDYIQKGREEFEKQPDTGFFGKTISRICNFIYYYFIVFLFAGILISIILYPLLLLTLGTLFFVLGLTAPIWMVAFIAIQYLFEVIIYDFDANSGSECTVFRLLVYIFIGIYKGPLQITGAALTIIWLLLSSVFHFFFSFIRYVARSIYDTFTILIIKTCGRVPVTENWLAWRVSGPGIGQKFYYSLDKNDVLMLVKAEIEKIQLEQYEKYIRNLIRQPKEFAIKLIKSIFERLQFVPENCYQLQDVTKSQKILEDKLGKQLEKRRVLYPQTSHLSKIRFTEDELKQNFNESCQLVSKAITTYDQSKITEATEKIWTRIFQSPEVLEPIKQSEWRFSLDKDVTQSEIYNVITTNNESLLNINGVSSFSQNQNEYQIIRLNNKLFQPKGSSAPQTSEDDKFIKQYSSIIHLYSNYSQYNNYKEDELILSQIITHEEKKK